MSWYDRLSLMGSEGQVMGQQSPIPGPPSYLVGEHSLFKSRSGIPDTRYEVAQGAGCPLCTSDQRAVCTPIGDGWGMLVAHPGQHEVFDRR